MALINRIQTAARQFLGGELLGGQPASFTRGAEIEILSEEAWAQSQRKLPQTTLRTNGSVPSGPVTLKVDPVTGKVVRVPQKRRRRRRLLTCSDRADIAFITATLGKGQLASGAINAVLSRRC